MCSEFVNRSSQMFCFSKMLCCIAQHISRNSSDFLWYISSHASNYSSILGYFHVSTFWFIWGIFWEPMGTVMLNWSISLDCLTNTFWAHYPDLTKKHFALICFHWSNQDIILCMSWQLSCHSMCKIMDWFDMYCLHESKIYFSIFGLWAPELFVKWVPFHGLLSVQLCDVPGQWRNGFIQDELFGDEIFTRFPA